MKWYICVVTGIKLMLLLNRYQYEFIYKSVWLPFDVVSFLC